MIEERRRSPRMTVTDAELTLVPFVSTVQVLDISAGGVLLELPRQPELGSRGRLRLTLDGVPFALQVQVQRVSQASDAIRAGRFHVAARFVEISPDDRQRIERCTTT